MVRSNREEVVDYDDYGNEKGYVSEFVGQDSSAYSLDGKSLIVPDYGDVDDMSSLGTSKYTYRGDGGGSAVGYIGDMKIVGKADDNEPEQPTMSSLEKKLSSRHHNDPAIFDLVYADGRPKADRKDVNLTQSFEGKKNEEEKYSKSACCIPRWITNAPLWLKLIIIASVALLLGALVLIGVGALLSSDKQTSPSSQESLGDQEDSTEFVVPEYSTTFMPGLETLFTDEPVFKVTLSPTARPSSAPVDTTLPPIETISTPDTEVPILEIEEPDLVAEMATDAPSVHGSSAPSAAPSKSPSTAPSSAPSSAPSAAPTTSFPSAAPTSSPSAAPSSSPSAAPSSSPSATPTSTPTTQPTFAPTGTPTQMPTSSTVNFFVMGGRFDGADTQILSNGLQSLPSLDESTVLIHLGDWNSPYSTSCVEDSFITNVDSYQQSTIPVYFIPGDNEYNDCPNPTEALGFWNQYLLGFESNYWQEPSWDVIRQSPDYSENFAFLERKVLFVGINLVGGIVHDQAEWNARHQANLLWIDTAAAKYDGQYTTMVVFAHADPLIEINNNFFADFYSMVERYDEQVIFVHRNLGIDTWKRESGYNGVPNLEVVAVEGSKWPPMWMQIDSRSGAYSIDQSSWYDEYMKKGTMPFSP